MNCFICDLDNQELLFKEVKDLEYKTYKPVNYYKCNKCNLIFQNPLPDKNSIKTFYPDDYRNYIPINHNIFSKLKKLQFKNLANKISKYLSRNGKILEIGFGNGELLLALKEKRFKNLSGCDFTDKNFYILKDKEIKLVCANIEEEFPFNEKFDTIIMNNVIEHLLDPLTVLNNCKKHLSKDGKVILITPNSSAIELSIFKKYWAGFHAPRHIFIFNKENIKQFGEKLNFSKTTTSSITDIGQWAISLQNILQDRDQTKVKLKNGMAWYLLPVSMTASPLPILQNLTGRSTSMMAILTN